VSRLFTGKTSEAEMTKRLHLIVLAATAVAISVPAVAGEIKGPPPTANYTSPEIDMHSRSICAFSGLNDSPLGDPTFGDPGGITQSFGSFFGSSGFPVSALDPRTDELSPGFSCNPNRGPDFHGG
jgi:hypothetical protein